MERRSVDYQTQLWNVRFLPVDVWLDSHLLGVGDAPSGVLLLYLRCSLPFLSLRTPLAIEPGVSLLNDGSYSAD